MILCRFIAITELVTAFHDKVPSQFWTGMGSLQIDFEFNISKMPNN